MNLLELTLIVITLSLFSVNSAAKLDDNPFLVDQFKSEFLHRQFLAIAFQQSLTLDDEWGIDLGFNFNGNVNRPYHIQLNQTDLSILLGTGRFHE